jgi:hypothetical protein
VLSDRKFNAVWIKKRKVESQCTKVLQRRIMVIIYQTSSVIQKFRRVFVVSCRKNVYVCLFVEEGKKLFLCLT